MSQVDDDNDAVADTAANGSAAAPVDTDPPATDPAVPPSGPPPPPPTGGDGPSLGPEPIGDAAVLVTDQIRNEVRDALELVDFVVKTGLRTAAGQSLSPDVFRMIKVTAGKIGLFETLTQPVRILASEWTRFELAYYALVEFTNPVTVETLRNTRNTGHFAFLEASSAQKFTWLLWTLTIAFVLIVLGCGAVSTGADTSPRAWGGWATTLNSYVPIIVPWIYGGLGACAYLLRTAHNLIAERSFDVRRKPEYLNRILLGAVSGGAVVLLFNSGSDDDTVKISAAALGFIAGYSNDLLFSAVERVVSAILPRVGVDTLQKERVVARPPLEVATAGVTMKDLIDKMDKAGTPEERELYSKLIAKLGERL